MARWLVEVRDVDGKLIETEGFLLRSSARRRAAVISEQGREMARVLAGAFPDDVDAPDAAYTAAVRRA